MRKNDFRLLLVVTVLGLVSYVLFRADPGAKNKVLVVRRDQQVIQRIQLNKTTAEKKLLIPVADGEIALSYDKDGAKVLSSPCPDKVCIHQGRINHSGQTIACVPEKVLITITTAAKENEHDAILR